jgi:CHAT domain-containing protein/tetratricopeptide (TPR) repeat protein
MKKLLAFRVVIRVIIDLVIYTLIKHDPTAAYPRALKNLERAQRTESNLLIGVCAYILGRAAHEYRPYPKLEEAIAAYNMALAKFLNFKTEYTHPIIMARADLVRGMLGTACITPQNYLSNAYVNLPTGDRAENLQRAIAGYKRNFGIFRKEFLDGSISYARMQNNLGFAYAGLPVEDQAVNLQRAITCYYEALRIVKEAAVGDSLEKPLESMRTQNNLGLAYADLPVGDRVENLQRAIGYYQNALCIYTEQDLLKNSRWKPTFRIYTKQELTEEYARTQHNLGIAYASLPTGDRAVNLQQALVCFQNALHIYTKQECPQEYARTQHNLGIVYFNLPIGDRRENLQKAIDACQNALCIYTAEQFPDFRIGTLYTLARVCCADPFHDWQKAYDLCVEAISVLETKVRSVASAETRRALAEEKAEIYHLVVLLCILMNKVDEALSYAERGKSRTLIEMLHNAQIHVPEETRTAFSRVRAKLEDLRYLQQIGVEKTPCDFEIDFYNEWQIRIHPIPTNETSPPENIWQLTEDLQRAYDILLQEIRKLDPEFAASEQVQPITVKEIEALIPEKTIFVECFTGNEGTYIFVLNGKGHIRNTTLILDKLTITEVFDRLVTDNWLTPYHNYQENCNDETYKAWLDTIENISKLLSEKFWYAKDKYGKSLSELIEQSGAERIVFIPHSGLHLMPLHLISLRPHPGPSTSSGQWSGVRLMDKYEIAYAPSASLLRFALKWERNDLTHFFAVANPDSSLIYTDAEVRGITAQFESFEGQQFSKILWHEQASKEAILTQTTGANIVHFSCHGSFQFANPIKSQLLLGIDNKACFTRKQYDEFREEFPHVEEILQPIIKSKDNNMYIEVEMISGEQRGKLGKEAYSMIIDQARERLTLQDIFAKLKLPNASVVVLSACETGMVKLERGDEYIGLPSGFLYAGSPTVISSLWAVDDLSTNLLMNRWYENVLQNKMGKAAALRDVQLWVQDLTYTDVLECLEREHFKQHIPREIIRSYKLKCADQPDEKPFEHPYYWGAFTCNGSWE